MKIRTLTAAAAAASLAVAAAPAPTIITDPCGGGIVPHADICALVVAPDVPDAATGEVTFTLVVDGDLEDRRPTGVWEASWFRDGCVWGLRWFHDPGADLPGEFSTRLDRDCDDSFTGFELEPPTIDGGSITSTVTMTDLQALDPELSPADVLERVGAASYSGVGTQADNYSQASYNHDTTERVDVPLQE